VEVSTVELTGLLLIRPEVCHDARGGFLEQFHTARYAELGVTEEFVQDNCSYSRRGCIRGLHYQAGDCAQGKLVMVLHGSILDVAVDIRFGSPTFGQHVAVELSSQNHVQLWVPTGFAHGFSALSEDAVVYYKCTSPYAATLERSVLFSDPDLGIDWRVRDPIVSEKDAAALPFRAIPRDFVYPGP
jgi:dTDP-4-dehydrorhamnose 3,5-epimerase